MRLPAIPLLIAIFLLQLTLVGCNTPSPAFRGIAPVRIVVNGSTFDVRINGNRAEAIRLNPEYAPRMSGIAPKAVFAIETVSGCKVTKLGGDQAMILANLSCGKAAAAVQEPRAIEYECDIDDRYVNQGLAQEVTDMTCRPVGF